jgi:hypothetical protein
MKMFKHIAFALISAMGISGTAYADYDVGQVEAEGKNGDPVSAGTTASCPHASLSGDTLKIPAVDVEGKTYQAEMTQQDGLTFSVNIDSIKLVDTSPSSSDGPRFTDNDDGTVTDNDSGLIWLKKTDCFEPQIWEEAMKSASNLADKEDGAEDCGLSDESTAGDWRLPTVHELQNLISYDYSYPALSNAKGDEQWKEGDAFSGVQTGNYWSSTAYVGGTGNAWFVYLGNGGVGYDDKANTAYVWPVRSGQP